MTEAERVARAVRQQVAGEHPDLESETGSMELLDRYVAELAGWGRRVHLFGKNDPVTTLPAQVADALTMLRCAQQARAACPEPDRATLSVADLGSGSGIPGIVWKIARPRWQVTLIERREKPAAFLRRTTALLGLEGIEVVEQDASRIERSGWDIVVSKAAGAFAQIFPLVRRLGRPGTLYVTAKGNAWPAEFGLAAPADFKVLATLPIDGGRGAAVAMLFVHPGPERFT